MPRRAGRKAKFITTLVYVDKPKVILLEARKAKVIGIAIDLGGLEHPFLATVVSNTNWQRYLRGSVDLRYLFVYANSPRLFVLDLGEMTEDFHVYLRLWREGQIERDYLPAPRFFSRYHTKPFPMERVQNARQSFLIDGEWDLPEFAQFFDGITDIYAIVISLRNLQSEAISDSVRKKIKDAFSRYLWRGGFSYFHFYNALYYAQAEHERLSVRDMHHSPTGNVDVSGRRDIFEYLHETIQHYELNRYRIQEQYRKLHDYLSEMMLLRDSGEGFDSGTPAAGYILDQSRELAALMIMPEFDLVYSLSDHNVLVTAKLVLSYFRRIEQSFAFFSEGRVEFLNLVD